MSTDLTQVVDPVVAIAALVYTPIGVNLLQFGGPLIARQQAKEAEAEARRRARALANSRSVKANVRGSSEVHFVCFGKVRAGGIFCAFGTKSDNSRVLHVGLAHSLANPGGCEDIANIWINDHKISESEISGDPLTTDAYVNLDRYISGGLPMVQLRHYRGTSTQTADTTLTADGITGGGATAYRRGIAWTRFTLTRPEDDPEGFEEAFPGGLPLLTVELKGNRCYDPRSDDTEGGSGTQRHSDPTSWVWSQNPAVIAATYMIMETSDGGMGYDPSVIDWPSVAAAANICDETVTNGSGSPTVSQVRYRCDVALDTAESREANLQKILDSMMGVRVRVGSKYKIYAGAYSSPEFNLDASYLRGAIKVSTRSPLDQLYNAVRITHDDAEQNYSTVEAPAFTSAAYEAQDGGERVWREEARPGVANTYQAQYIGTVLGQMSRQQKTIEVPCNLKALNLECWQIGRVTLDELGLDADTYRLIGFDWESDGPRLILREETADVWTVNNYLAADFTSTPGLSSEIPPRPTGFTATASADGVLLTWDGPSPQGAPFVDIYRASGSGSPQVFSLIKRGVLGTEYTDEPSDSTSYHYKIRRRSQSGQVSDFTPEDTATTGSLKVAGSGAQVGDQRNALAVMATRSPAISSANPLSAVDLLTARIDIAAFNYQFGFGQVSYNSGQITGLLNSTLYYVYLTDPTFAGGAVTYAATTTPQNIVAGSGRLYVGNITTPADGGGGTSGNDDQSKP